MFNYASLKGNVVNGVMLSTSKITSPNVVQVHNVESLETYLGVTPITFEETTGFFRNQSGQIVAHRVNESDE